MKTQNNKQSKEQDFNRDFEAFLSNKDLAKPDFKAFISFQDFRSLVSELQRQGKVSDFKHWVESNGEESNIYGTITVEGVYHEYTWYMYSNQLEIKIEIGGKL